MEKFVEIGHEWSELSQKLRTECIAYIRSVIDEAPNDEFEFDDDCWVTIHYDADNDYSSNPYSTVHTIRYNNKGQIVLDIEDATGYQLDYVPTVELYAIAEMVLAQIDRTEL